MSPSLFRTISTYGPVDHPRGRLVDIGLVLTFAPLADVGQKFPQHLRNHSERGSM